MDRLLTVDRADLGPRSRCTDLVPLSTERCLDCNGPTFDQSVYQRALFRHGGYGETTAFKERVCMSCSTARTIATESLNPRYH